MLSQTKPQISDLEKEHNQLKAELCKKFTKFMIVMFILTSIVELTRAISLAQMSIMVTPTIGILGAIALLWLMSEQKSNQERIITVFNIITYSMGLYSHYTGTGYFNNTSDTFYFAYSYALLERIVVDRVPSASYKMVFYLLATLVRPLIIPLHDMGLFFIQCFFITTTIYFEFDQEKHYKRLFGSYFHSKEQLGKFKDLVENYIPEGIIVVTRNSMKSLFVNNAFKALFETNRDLDLKTQLDSFYLRESLSSSGNLDSPVPPKSSSNVNKTLLTLLLDKVHPKGESVKKRSFYHLGFTKEVPDQPNNPENKIFEAKILDITWDEVPAFAIVLHDITQQQTILQLKIAADLNKDRVLATVSHELRTPLNGILGMIQIMFKKIQDQELLQYLKICKNSANLLIGLVNSILDLNQIRFNKFRLSHDKVNLHEMLRDIVSMFEYQCLQKGISLKLQIASQVPRTMITDKNRLSQIFINLVGNAVKFTVRGGITITARESRNPEMVEFSVEDTGMGIRREDRDKLFMMYGRLDQDDKKINQQGVGLGLTISNSLAQILCGDDSLGGIKVESEYGKGSIFTFFIRKVIYSGSLMDTRLEVQETYPSASESFFVEEVKGVDLKVKAYQMQPLKRNPGNSAQVLSSPHSPKSSATFNPKESINTFSLAKFNSDALPKKIEPTIFIIDDNPFNITVASHLVSNQGFNVKSALYGQTAIEMIFKNDHLNEPIRLILMDCQMPVMDGYETTRHLIKLMREGKIPQIPIVALTANNSAGDREECKKSGMCDYLHKPLTEANLVRILKKYSCK